MSTQHCHKCPSLSLFLENLFDNLRILKEWCYRIQPYLTSTTMRVLLSVAWGHPPLLGTKRPPAQVLSSALANRWSCSPSCLIGVGVGLVSLGWSFQRSRKTHQRYLSSHITWKFLGGSWTTALLCWSLCSNQIVYIDHKLYLVFSPYSSG